MQKSQVHPSCFTLVITATIIIIIILFSASTTSVEAANDDGLHKKIFPTSFSINNDNNKKKNDAPTSVHDIDRAFRELFLLHNNNDKNKSETVAASRVTFVALTHKDCSSCKAFRSTWIQVAKQFSTSAKFVWVDCAFSQAVSDFCLNSNRNGLFPEKISRFPFVSALLSSSSSSFVSRIEGDEGLQPEINQATGKAAIRQKENNANSNEQEEEEEEEEEDIPRWTLNRLQHRIETILNPISKFDSIDKNFASLILSSRNSSLSSSSSSSLLKLKESVVEIVSYIPQRESDLSSAHHQAKTCDSFPPKQKEINKKTLHAFRQAASFYSLSHQHSFHLIEEEVKMVELMTTRQNHRDYETAEIIEDEEATNNNNDQLEQESEMEQEQGNDVQNSKDIPSSKLISQREKNKNKLKNKRSNNFVLFTDADQQNGVVSSFVAEHTSAILKRDARDLEEIQSCIYTSKPVIGILHCAEFHKYDDDEGIQEKLNTNNNNNVLCKQYSVRYHWLPETLNGILALLVKVARPRVSVITTSDQERFFPGRVASVHEPLSLSLSRPFAFEFHRHSNPLLGHHHHHQQHQHQHQHHHHQQDQQHHHHQHLHHQEGPHHHLLNHQQQEQQQQQQHAPPIFAVFVESISCQGRPKSFQQIFPLLEHLAGKYQNTTFAIFDSLRYSEYYLRSGLTRPLLDKLKLNMVIMDHGRKFSVVQALEKRNWTRDEKYLDLVQNSTLLRAKTKSSSSSSFDFNVEIAEMFLNYFWSNKLRPYGKVLRSSSSISSSIRLYTARAVLDFFRVHQQKPKEGEEKLKKEAERSINDTNNNNNNNSSNTSSSSSSSSSSPSQEDSIRVLLVESPIREISPPLTSLFTFLAQEASHIRQEGGAEMKVDEEQNINNLMTKSATTRRKDGGIIHQKKKRNNHNNATRTFLKLARFAVVNGDGRGALASESLYPQRRSSSFPFIVCVATHTRFHHRGKQPFFASSSPSFIEFDAKRTNEFRSKMTQLERAALVLSWLKGLDCAKSGGNN